jgi:hypothetical protein
VPCRGPVPRTSKQAMYSPTFARLGHSNTYAAPAVPITRLEPLVLPLTCAMLVALFAIPRRGTGSIGNLFGPVMMVWFLTLAALGLEPGHATAPTPSSGTVSP